MISYQYTDFGETIIGGDTDFYNEICYNGGIYDKSTGLYYLNARYYNPTDGRFISRDSYKGNLSNPSTLHLYAYCKNNPVTYSDPSGHVAISRIIGGIVGGGIGAYVGSKIAKKTKATGLKKAAKAVKKKVTSAAKKLKATKKTAKKATKPKVSSAKSVSKTKKYQVKKAPEIKNSTINNKNGIFRKYEVGAYKDIKGAKDLDAHHVGQKALMKKFVSNYNPQTAPAVNVPKVGHTILEPNGIVPRSTKGINNARQILARDLFELKRVYPDIPNVVFRKLIDMNILHKMRKYNV